MKTTIQSIVIAMAWCFVGSGTGMNAQSIAGSAYRSAFVCADGSAQAVGKNEFGQLGTGTGIPGSTATPLQVAALTGITAVAGIGDHCLFVKNDGTAWAVGYNVSGQLGIGTTLNKNTPVQVTGLTGITAVAGGQVHSLFLKNDGTVWAAGNNANGQLGDGTTVSKSTPVQVIGLTGIISIAAAYNHSLFVKNDGTVWAVGSNYYGQLGDGTDVNKTTPVQVSGLTGITAVSGGQGHSLFLKNDGTVWSVGWNYFGQLGDGTLLSKFTPVQVSGLTGIVGLAAGYIQSYFMQNDGTVWAIGSNQSGALGDGTSGNYRTLPVQVLGLTGIISVAAGNLHSLFLKDDATVWAVGLNSYGQLGDGTNVDKSVAVQVTGLCSALGTAENSVVNAIAVYPNPCSEQLIIESDEYQNTTAKIFNVQGQLLQSIPLQNFKTTLQIDDLALGVYLVQVKNPKGMTVKKIIKN
jgi:alpha-tubulin suppressor-like RCC1 family protein